MELLIIILFATLYGWIGGMMFAGRLLIAMRSSDSDELEHFIEFIVLSQTWPVSMWFYKK